MEMAIILPVLLLVLGGIVDLGRALYGQIIISNAAREGARMVSVSGYSTTQVQDRVRLASGGISPMVVPATNLTITPTACPASPAPTDSGTVTVTATGFGWLMLNVVPQLVGGNIPAPNLTATASMRCVA
ncbi:TadE/TadG family type IV pilus assembly protein [Knoellia sp. 3-2P3]|uniref:TadE/TadG family type IV pilus assembly protein n=1 Tax=unclassified Knoellia TaxID=2618719 RepID=UPI0023DA53D4|nr:TadE/TadG family type IV pilus assembly protein [Knoellia sp. 3-2P3]MDF2093093.1 TadE/TadG family type IV pilus assembly protein [Knoellia sp. 3-2P3]